MPEFLQLMTPPEARQKFLAALTHRVGGEQAATRAALGRTLATDVLAAEDLPPFARSTVDGYAVRAADTHGASESLPVYLRLVGEVAMGQPAGLTLSSGECAAIHTGGMLPENADGVLMLEYSQPAGAEIEALRAVAVGENVILAGEELHAGQVALTAGRRLRAEELGGLMALGVTEVNVRQRPRVAILSSGDEVVPPEATPQIGQVRDINATTLAALVTGAGGEPVLYGIVPDDLDELAQRAGQALAECDALVITAGSSASVRDLTAAALGGLGAPGLLVHGVSVRPGKPTILGVSQGKPTLGLPGNPASALVIARLFLLPAIAALLGDTTPPARPIRARVRVNLPSQAGREDWLAVRLAEEDGDLWAEPVYGKSNQIFMLAGGEGLLFIPAEVTGLMAGDWAAVYPY